MAARSADARCLFCYAAGFEASACEAARHRGFRADASTPVLVSVVREAFARQYGEATFAGFENGEARGTFTARDAADALTFLAPSLVGAKRLADLMTTGTVAWMEGGAVLCIRLA